MTDLDSRFKAAIHDLNLFKIFKKDPPMTRFVALQLGKSHYFDHTKAYQDFGYRPIVSMEEGLHRLGENSAQ